MFVICKSEVENYRLVNHHSLVLCQEECSFQFPQLALGIIINSYLTGSPHTSANLASYRICSTPFCHFISCSSILSIFYHCILPPYVGDQEPHGISQHTDLGLARYVGIRSIFVTGGEVPQRGSQHWSRSVHLGPYLNRAGKLVLRIGLTPQGGLPILGAINSVDVPDSALPPLPPCDPPHAEMAGIWAPGGPRRHQT